MTGFIDASILSLLAEHGPMTTREMFPHLYPDVGAGCRTDKVRYIYKRCAHMMKDELLDKKISDDGTAMWSLREGEE